jgi:hypothetical protein
MRSDSVFEVDEMVATSGEGCGFLGIILTSIVLQLPKTGHHWCTPTTNAFYFEIEKAW